MSKDNVIKSYLFGSAPLVSSYYVQVGDSIYDDKGLSLRVVNKSVTRTIGNVRDTFKFDDGSTKSLYRFSDTCKIALATSTELIMFLKTPVQHLEVSGPSIICGGDIDVIDRSYIPKLGEIWLTSQDHLPVVVVEIAKYYNDKSTQIAVVYRLHKPYQYVAYPMDVFTKEFVKSESND